MSVSDFLRLLEAHQMLSIWKYMPLRYLGAILNFDGVPKNKQINFKMILWTFWWS